MFTETIKFERYETTRDARTRQDRLWIDHRIPARLVPIGAYDTYAQREALPTGVEWTAYVLND